MKLPLLAGALSAWARWRRRRGRYDARTLAGFASAWHHTGSPSALLRLAAFRRDLGRPLPQRWVLPLTQGLASLSASQRRVALGLLGEVARERLATLSPAAWEEAATSMPLAASRCVAHAAPVGQVAARDALARIHSEQPRWRAEFAQWIRSCATAQGVCVVGNAATLRDGGLGTRIDAYAAVLRFNQFAGAGPDDDVDLGRRLDVWVVSHGHRGLRPAAARFAVMSGPDPCFRPQNWEAVLALAAAGTPVLTVPLAVWRDLVRDLRAPPSAGLLLLAWLRVLNGSWDGISCAGIGAGLDRQGRYHATDSRQRAGGRHDWHAESAVVAHWHAAGLARLTR
jgi:hypothetical protein